MQNLNIHKALQRNADMKIPAEFDAVACDLVERFAKTYDEKSFYPYSFPKDYSFDYPAVLELDSYAMHDGEEGADEYFPSEDLLQRIVDNYEPGDDNFFLSQGNREYITELLIDEFIQNQKDSIPTTNADFLLHLPSELEVYIPQYMEKIAEELASMFPDKQIRISATTWGAESPDRSAGFYLSYILYNIYEIDEEDELYEKFLTPTEDVVGHAIYLNERDGLDLDDSISDDYLKGLIEDFDQASLFTDETTSSDLIDFVEHSRGNVSIADIHAHDAKNALKEAVETTIDEYHSVYIDATDVCFIIYIGPNFEEKKTLLYSARKTIRNCIRDKFNDSIQIRLAIALDEDLSGGGDLRLYVIS